MTTTTTNGTGFYVEIVSNVYVNWGMVDLLVLHFL